MLRVRPGIWQVAWPLSQRAVGRQEDRQKPTRGDECWMNSLRSVPSVRPVGAVLKSRLHTFWLGIMDIAVHASKSNRGKRTTTTVRRAPVARVTTLVALALKCRAATTVSRTGSVLTAARGGIALLASWCRHWKECGAFAQDRCQTDSAFTVWGYWHISPCGDIGTSMCFERMCRYKHMHKR